MKKIFTLSLVLSIQISFGQFWTELGGYLSNYNFDTFSNNAMIYDIEIGNSGVVYTTAKDRVVQWNGINWNYVGNNGIPTSYTMGMDLVFCLAIDNSGNLYAAGRFENSTGNKFVAKWDGSTWTELGGQNALHANDEIKAIYIDANNNVYVGGKFKNTQGNVYVAKFDGVSWSSLGGTGLTDNNLDYINSLSGNNNGTIYCAGSFTNNSSNQYLAACDQFSWFELGGNNGLAGNYANSNWGGEMNSVVVDAQNNVYVGGNFTNASGNRFVAKYNGSSWSELGGANTLAGLGVFNGGVSFISDVYSVNDNIFVTGNYTSTGPNRFVARYYNNQWTELGADGSLGATSWINAIAANNSQIYVAGNFGYSLFNGNVTARYVATADYNLVLESGCMDSTACNYNPSAVISDVCFSIGSACDDGVMFTMNDVYNDSCICEGTLIISGCMDPLACNYDVFANVEDGGCLMVGDLCDDGDPNTTGDMVGNDCQCLGVVMVYGCMDSLACNYNVDANVSNGNCLMIGSPCDDSLANTINDVVDANCECHGETISGVEEALNASITIFPNPANDMLTIQWKNAPDESIRVYDMRGACIAMIPATSTQLFHTTSWSNGLYQLVSSSGTLKRLVEIQH